MPRASNPAPTGPLNHPASEDSRFSLRILATSDLHVNLTPWDYYADRSSASGGLARTASLIAAARAEAATCLLLDNGDFLQGSPMGDMVFQGKTPHEIHPMIAAMNALGYDAVTLGNHEFSNGLPFLMQQLRMARFPVVSANIVRRLGSSPLLDQTLVPATVILNRALTNNRGETKTLRIGIIGLAPPQTTLWDRQHLGNLVSTRDIVEAAAAHVPKLRRDGADIVIALSHSGIGPPHPHERMEDATAALAAIAGIDALVAGHTHQTFPSPSFAETAEIDPVRGLLWGKPAVMPGFHGSHLGIIDLRLTCAAGKWHLFDAQVSLRPIARRTRTGRVMALTKSAPEIIAIALKAHRATRRWAVTPIGNSTEPLHSFFALIAPCPAIRLIAQAQTAHVAAKLAGGPHAHLPILSAASPFHAGGRAGPENYTNIPPGPLVMRNAYDLYPHPNTVAALRVTGAELAQWLERSFSLMHQVTPGAQDAQLINPAIPSYNFDVIEGLEWQIDLSAPPRYDDQGKILNAQSQRVHNLRFNGAPLDPTQEFVLATNSYRAVGSGGFAGSGPDRIILTGSDSSLNVLQSHITKLGTLPPAPPPNWCFLPMPGTTLLFCTSPAANQYLSDIASLRPEPLDLTPTGFRRFRLHL